MAELPQFEKPARLMSLDAYRGFVMLAMASGGLALGSAARDAATIAHFDGTSCESVWKGLCAFVAYQLDHVKWTGCSAWDLIQPSFMFMVGVAMPYSYAARNAQGHSRLQTFGHVLLRATVLVLLGVFLRSKSSPQTNFTFEDVLSQIGFAYPFVYLTLGRGFKLQLAAVSLVLGLDWYLFYQHPLPPGDLDPAQYGIPPDYKFLSGLGAHWNMNTNFAAWSDRYFLNLFPRAEPFAFNRGGYQTLNFVPSIATMIFGVMAGELLRGPLSPGQKVSRLLSSGALCLVLGMAVDGTIWPYFHFEWTLCPVVKKVWSPSWVVFSTGWTLWMLAGFYWIIDVKGWKVWAFPLVVVGMNSIAIYCLAQLLKPWISTTLKTHFGQEIFAVNNGRILESAAQLGVLWLICLWLYRQKIFIRV